MNRYERHMLAKATENAAKSLKAEEDKDAEYVRMERMFREHQQNQRLEQLARMVSREPARYSFIRASQPEPDRAAPPPLDSWADAFDRSMAGIPDPQRNQR